jgi:ADP-ribose pyrophosphatase YjhB (NUDIX family)
MTIKCIIHGSFSKHFSEIKKASELFRAAGIEVLAPKHGELVPENNGFALFEDEKEQDPRLIELLYLHNLKRLGSEGFSYFVSPGGYIGKSASYELGIAQLTNTRIFFSHQLNDHPAYIHKNSIWSPSALADYVSTNDSLPTPQVYRNEKLIHKLWEDLMVPGSVVAAGAIIEHQPKNSHAEREILLVKTHKWGNRYSIVGGKVRRNERLQDALLREVKEETGLSGEVGRHIITFDQLKNSGYYRSGVQHIFVDNVVSVKNKKVILNDEAQDHIWALPNEALSQLDIEPNARETIELYYKQLQIK